ncbi:MAG: PssE/Cps14G family polysaccharide biosynthesis glycosyltransferase [Lachnospiraceae bacterium]|nr:PssE/Cps14G family polysaccharide biosynthesis glycosyltransferase [Lachnospiraceae bacterium]
MVFISVGTQKFPFDRLLEAVDRCIAEGVIKDEVFAQTGNCRYEPLYYKCSRFLDQVEYKELMKRSDLVITHAGTGAIIGAVKDHKKVIAVPRYAKYGEHIDNHQTQVLSAFEEMGYIEACYHTEELEKAIEATRKKSYRVYKSNTDRFVADVKNSIEELLP